MKSFSTLMVLAFLSTSFVAHADEEGLKVEQKAVKALFGKDAIKELQLEKRTIMPTRSYKYNFTSYEAKDVKKEYMSWHNLGSEKGLSFCPTYMSVLEKVIIEGESLEVTFHTSLMKFNLIQAAAHNAYTQVVYGGRDSADNFTDAEAIATKTMNVNLDTLKENAVTHRELIRQCEQKRNYTHHAEWREKEYVNNLVIIDEKLAEMSK